jgi:hypothetical protein
VPESDFGSVGDGDEDDGVGRGEAERVKRQGRRSDLFLLDLFDGADAVIGVNDFLADFKAHHTPPVLQKTGPRRKSGMGFPLRVRCDAAASVREF